MDLALFKVNHLGDSLVFLPVVQALARLHPDVRPTLWVDERSRRLFEADLSPTQLVTVQAEQFFSGGRHPWQFITHFRRLRGLRPAGSLLSPDQGTVAHILARVAGGPVRAGATDVARRFSGLTHDVRWRDGWSFGRWNWEIARTCLGALGREAWPAEPSPPNLAHLAPQIEAAPRPHVVIHAGAKQALRRWPRERFAALATRLATTANVTWIDRPDTAGPPLPHPIRTVAPQTLDALASELASAWLFVGNNSGPMHLACALGVHGVVLSGPSHPGWDPEWHRERWTVLRHPHLPCQPCETIARGVTHCHHSAAPLACLDYWQVDRVEAICQAKLARPFTAVSR